MEGTSALQPRPAFLVYESYFEAIKLVPKNRQGRLCYYLIECGLNQRTVESVPYPYNAILRQMITNVEYSDRRYYAARKNGEKGGSPKIAVDLELAQRLYDELRDWSEVAKRMDMSRATLFRARKAAGLV